MRANVVDDLKLMMFTARVSASKAICSNIERFCPDSGVKDSSVKLSSMYSDLQSLIDESQNKRNADIIIDELETMHDKLEELLNRHVKLVKTSCNDNAIESAENDVHALRLLRM